MKILIIDRDQSSSNLLASRFKEQGHEVFEEQIKNEGLEKMSAERIDIVFIDPSPMQDVRAIALNIRRTIRSYPYIIYMSTDKINVQDVIEAGCNDLLNKPIDPKAAEQKIKNAKHMLNMMTRINDDSEDFPSAGGVIAKSAFNQLFLSAIDRGTRYNERSYVLSIGIENYHEIKSLDGNYNADYAVSKLAYHLVRLRRQSDVIGQTGAHEFSLLLQRTQDKDEPEEAAKRFSATIEELDDIQPVEGGRVRIYIRLTELPGGQLPYQHIVA